MKKNRLLLLFMLIVQFAFSQTEKMIYGKIIVKDATPQGVLVLNLVNEKETITNKQGEFSILAKPEDVLVFSAVHLDYQRKIIEQEDYDLGKITIAMTSKVNQLEEVEINKNIDAVSLGILSRPAKSYTPAERRLKTATSLNPTANMGSMMGGSLSIDPLLNWMSGRTALLKSELKVEQKEILLKKLNDIYEPEYYTEKLLIPYEYIKAFQYYCVEDKKFAEAIQSKNETMIDFLIGMLATEYKFLNNEKK